MQSIIASDAGSGASSSAVEGEPQGPTGEPQGCVQEVRRLSQAFRPSDLARAPARSFHVHSLLPPDGRAGGAGTAAASSGTSATGERGADVIVAAIVQRHRLMGRLVVLQAGRDILLRCATSAPQATTPVTSAPRGGRFTSPLPHHRRRGRMSASSAAARACCPHRCPQS